MPQVVASLTIVILMTLEAGIFYNCNMFCTGYRTLNASEFN